MRRVRLYLFFLVAALLVGGCRTSILRCRSEALYPTFLASEQVRTPDPCRLNFYGQQIVVHWNLPRNYPLTALTLEIQVRYGNLQVERVAIGITKKEGFWLYRLIDSEYYEKQGIISFAVRLLDNEKVLDEWKHSLWADIIEIHHE